VTLTARVRSYFSDPAQVMRLVKFLVVGGGSTLLYAAIANGLVYMGGLRAVQASVIAYLAGMVFSYFGHKHVTFHSNGSHGSELPRFIATNALGYAIAYFAPVVLTEHMGFAPAWAFLFVIVAVPVINFCLLTFFVFARGARNVSP